MKCSATTKVGKPCQADATYIELDGRNVCAKHHGERATAVRQFRRVLALGDVRPNVLKWMADNSYSLSDLFKDLDLYLERSKPLSTTGSEAGDRLRRLTEAAGREVE